jgi:hypothetical protein
MIETPILEGRSMNVIAVAVVVVVTPFAIALAYMHADERRSSRGLLFPSKASKQKRRESIEQGRLADLGDDPE